MAANSDAVENEDDGIRWQGRRFTKAEEEQNPTERFYSLLMPPSPGSRIFIVMCVPAHGENYR
jgi:hypothetical protein